MAHDCIARGASPDRVRVITNGFDESDFAAVAPAPEDARRDLTVVHVGAVYPGTVAPVAAAFARARDAGVTNLQLIYLGAGEVAEEELAALGRHRDAVRVTARVPRRVSVASTCAADVLLVSLIDAPAARKWYPSKLFEYLRSGRPIFAMVPPDSIAADLLRQSGRARIFAPSDVSGLAQAMIDAASRGRVPTVAPPAGLVAPFERRATVAQLAATLAAVCRPAADRVVGTNAEATT
jgi:glycosyltransferase involved in cell wall biosynthesis